MKQLTFCKQDDRYMVEYDNTRELINSLVDIADDQRFNLDLMDVFVIVHRLGSQNKSPRRSDRTLPT